MAEPQEPRLSNNPPGPLEYAKHVIQQMSDWMIQSPVIIEESQAREAKIWVDRAKAAFTEVEQERVKLVSPLNEEVNTINAAYKSQHNTDKKKPGTLDKVLNELSRRMQTYLLAEEQKRIRAAKEAQARREEAERLAREAERKESEAIANAAQGECDIDIATISTDADKAFEEFQQADRAAALAIKETKAKVGGGFSRSLSLRERETLVVVDWQAAIEFMGLTDSIRDAILSSARIFRKDMGELPPGIEAKYERGL